jgi:hypothetical protein
MSKLKNKVKTKYRNRSKSDNRSTIVWFLPIALFLLPMLLGIGPEEIEVDEPETVRKAPEQSGSPEPSSQPKTPPSPADAPSPRRELVVIAFSKLIPIDTTRPVTDLLHLKAKKPGYLLEGKLEIKKNGKLKIDPGVTIVAARKARIDVEGFVECFGTLDDPIVFVGEVPATGVWRGFRIETSQPCRFEHCIIADSSHAFFVTDNSDTIVSDTLLARNLTGIYFKRGSWKLSNVEIRECKEYAILAVEDTSVYKHVSLVDNASLAYYSTYKGAPGMFDCVIARNLGGGIRCDGALRQSVSTPSIHQSVIMENGRFQVFCNTRADWNCRRNYWGMALTYRMKNRKRLKGIIDGRNRALAFIKRERPTGVVQYEPPLKTKTPNAGADQTMEFKRDLLSRLRIAR